MSAHDGDDEDYYGTVAEFEAEFHEAEFTIEDGTLYKIAYKESINDAACLIYGGSDGTICLYHVDKDKWSYPKLTQRYDGYLMVSIPKATGRRQYWQPLVHSIIIRAFKGPPPFASSIVRHIDDDQRNNRPDNLAYGSVSDNRIDADNHKYNGTEPKDRKVMIPLRRDVYQRLRTRSGLKGQSFYYYIQRILELHLDSV